MNTLAIASGKGGTGKTTVAVCLYNILSDKLKDKVKLYDCDVEEPNDRIFFPEASVLGQDEIFKMVPLISEDACTYCRKCVEYCEFNAIVVLPSAEFAEVNADLCHSCGACLVACGDNAIKEVPVPIGFINEYMPENGKGLVEGRLKIGSAMQTMLIRELKHRHSESDNITIFDAPPGSSCPVVETISDADYIILVAEPTPFGLHDLNLMVSLLREIKKSCGVVINKSGIGNNDIYKYLEEQQIELLGEIPFSVDFARAYSSGKLFKEMPPTIREKFDKIAETVLHKIIQ